jgi:hypothetical protein
MSLLVHCDKCGVELVVQGALVFGPPEPDKGNLISIKLHLCRQCWRALNRWMRATK